MTTVKKGKLLLSKTAQENAVQKNERSCIDVHNTALRCSVTRPISAELSSDRHRRQPLFPKEVETAVQSIKKGKSAGVDNIPEELVQADGEAVITAATTVLSKICQTGEWPIPVSYTHLTLPTKLSV